MPMPVSSQVIQSIFFSQLPAERRAKNCGGHVAMNTLDYPNQLYHKTMNRLHGVRTRAFRSDRSDHVLEQARNRDGNAGS